MKYLLVICVLAAFIAASNAALALIPPDKTPGHPGHCNSDVTGPMEKDEVKTIENCTRASCLDDGFIQLATCSPFQTPCGKTDLDLSKPYPDCCPQPKSC